MKRILIITYYWPPSGGGGVMRWLKMSKYFPEYGWQPVVYTPENPDPSVIDKSLIGDVHEVTEVIKTPIWEPYNIYRWLTGKPKSEKFKAGHISEASQSSLKDRISVFIRGNFLIPDPRKFWVNPSIKYLDKYLRENQIDLIVTTGPPHSMHLIGLGLKKNHKIPWIADFRDPWTTIDFYHKLKLTRWADNRHKSLERKVFQNADYITTVSPNVAAGLEKLSGKKVYVINNGYDHEDFIFEDTEPDPNFVISHFGSFNLDRNPEILWEVLGEIAGQSEEFSDKLRIQLIGQTHEKIIAQIVENRLERNLIIIPPMEHREGLKRMKKSQILLLPLNDSPNVLGILPGKMYEYLALKRPILAIGPHGGDFELIIKETDSGVIHDINDRVGLRNSLRKYFELYKKNQLHINSMGIDRYSRRDLAKKIIEIPFT